MTYEIHYSERSSIVNSNAERENKNRHREREPGRKWHDDDYCHNYCHLVAKSAVAALTLARMSRLEADGKHGFSPFFCFWFSFLGALTVVFQTQPYGR